MSFRLLRLPSVALREVIKSMNMRELLLFPFLSEKCHQIVKASISKKSSLEISFTPEINFINVKFAPELIFEVRWPDQDPGHHYRIEDKLDIIAHFSTCNRCVKFKWTRSGQMVEDEELIRKMLEYFTDTYKAMVSFNFDVEIRQDFAMELIRYCRQNNIRLSWIKFDYGSSASPEYVREILEGFIDEEGSLAISSSLPKGFEYTPPPGGFKFAGLVVSDAHWVDLNDFLQCRLVDVSGDLSHMTPQYLNNVFKTIVNTDCRIEKLFIISTSLNQNSYPEIIEGLSDRPLEVKRIVEFKARNGRQTGILFRNPAIILQLE